MERKCDSKTICSASTQPLYKYSFGRIVILLQAVAINNPDFSILLVEITNVGGFPKVSRTLVHLLVDEVMKIERIVGIIVLIRCVVCALSGSGAAVGGCEHCRYWRLKVCVCVAGVVCVLCYAAAGEVLGVNWTCRGVARGIGSNAERWIAALRCSSHDRRRCKGGGTRQAEISF